MNTFVGCIALLMWAMLPVFTMLITNIPVFEILMIAFSASFLLTTVKLTVSRQWAKIKQPLAVWVFGVGGVFGNEVLFIAASKHAPIIHATLIYYLWPIFVVLFAGLLPKDRFSLRHLFASVLGLLGVSVIYLDSPDLLTVSTQYLFGYMLALMSAMVWSVYTLSSRYYDHDVTEMVGVYCGATAVFSGILHWRYEIFVLPTMSQCLVILLMGLTTQGLAYFFWDYSSKRGNYKLLCLLSYWNPLLSFALLAILGLSQPTFYMYIAAMLIIIGNMTSHISWKRGVHLNQTVEV